MDLIHGVGSNGIAGIFLGGGCPKSTAFKLSAGEHSPATSVKFEPIVIRATYFVVAVSARLFSNGRTTRLFRCCQSNANQSPKWQATSLSGCKPTPFGQGG